MPTKDKRQYPTSYPTKQEILKKAKGLKDQLANDIKILKCWKQNFYKDKWNKIGSKEKCLSLKALIFSIYQDPYLPTVFITVKKTPYNYLVNSDGIHVVNIEEDKPSIVSTLHEIGHLMLGEDELEACAYSFALYSTVFPKELQFLKWDNHLLNKC